MKLNKIVKTAILLLAIDLLLSSCTFVENAESQDNEIHSNDMAIETKSIRHEVDYSDYSKKIWICENSVNYEGAQDLFLYLDEADNGNIFGEISVGKMPISSHFYYNPPFDSKYQWNLMGILDDDIAKCKLATKDGNSNVSMSFNEGNIVLTGDLVMDDNSSFKKANVFKPYTIADVDLTYHNSGISIDFLSDYSNEIVIDSWGEIRVVSIMVNSKKPHPLFFLTNDENEILYQFNAPFQNGLDVIAFLVEDVNIDGLQDVVIILGDDEETIKGVVSWIFFQIEDGVFCIDTNTQKKLNTEFYNKTQLNIEKIKAFLNAL